MQVAQLHMHLACSSSANLSPCAGMLTISARYSNQSVMPHETWRYYQSTSSRTHAQILQNVQCHARSKSCHGGLSMCVWGRHRGHGCNEPVICCRQEKGAKLNAFRTLYTRQQDIIQKLRRQLELLQRQGPAGCNPSDPHLQDPPPQPTSVESEPLQVPHPSPVMQPQMVHAQGPTAQPHSVQHNPAGVHWTALGIVGGGLRSGFTGGGYNNPTPQSSIGAGLGRQMPSPQASPRGLGTTSLGASEGPSLGSGSLPHSRSWTPMSGNQGSGAGTPTGQTGLQGQGNILCGRLLIDSLPQASPNVPQRNLSQPHSAGPNTRDIAGWTCR